MNPLTQRLLMSAAGKAAIPGAWNLGSIGNDPFTGSTSDITAAGIFDGRLVFGTATGVVFTQQINRSWVPRFGSELLGPVRKIDSFSGGNWAAGKGYFIREYAGESLSGALYGGTGEWGTTSSNASAVLSMRFATKPVVGNDLNIVVFGGEKGALAFTTDRGTTITRGIAPGTSGLGTLGDVVEIIFKETPVYTGDSQGWWAFYRGGSYVYTAGIDGGYNPNNWSGSTLRNDLKNLFQIGETVLNVKLILNQFVVITNFGRIFLSYTGFNWELRKDIRTGVNNHSFQDAVFDGQNYLVLSSLQSGNQIQVFSNTLGNTSDIDDYNSFSIEFASQRPLGNVIFYYDNRYYIGLPNGNYLYKDVTVSPVTKAPIQPMQLTLYPSATFNIFIDYFWYAGNRVELGDVVVVNEEGQSVRESVNGSSVQCTRIANAIGSDAIFYGTTKNLRKLSISCGASGKVKVFGRRYGFQTVRSFITTVNVAPDFLSDIRSIDRWGNAEFLTLEGAFANNYYLNNITTEVMPPFSRCHSMAGMFANCTSLNQFPKIPAALGAVITVSGMLYNCREFNQPIVNESGGTLNTFRLVDASYLLYNAIKWNNTIKLELSQSGSPVESYTKSLSYMFAGCKALTGTFDNSITNLQFITDNAYSIKCSGMFENCSLFDANLVPSGNIWNTSRVTAMNKMFYLCSKFNGNITGWNVSNVTDMSNMFYGAPLFNQAISSWNTSNVQNMSGMFIGATNFNKNINYNSTSGAWNTSKVTNMNSMFLNAKNFNNGELTNNPVAPLNWNTLNVNDMSSMFQFAVKFNQPIGSWRTDNVLLMRRMFWGASIFNQPIAYDPVMGTWNTGKVTNTSEMFREAEEFNQPIGNWNMIMNTRFDWMFNGAFKFNQNIGNWDTRSVTNMQFMFAGAKSFNNGSPNDNPVFPLKWRTNNVLDMAYMFSGAIDFNQPLTFEFDQSISGYLWLTDRVVSMSNMFNGCVRFNRDIRRWDVSSVVYMDGMFQSCSSFNSDISGWNVNKVRTMDRMFAGASVFNSPIGNWGSKTSNVTSMASMFSGALLFNQDLNAWNTSNVTNMRSMFYINIGNPPAFNGDIGNWNTSKVIDMSYMFSGTLFNKPIDYNSQTGAWNTISVTNMAGMFSKSTFNQPITNWNVSNVTNMEYMFSNNRQFNQLISTWNTSKLVRVRGMFSGATAFNNGGFLFDRYRRSDGITLTGWDTSKVIDSGYDAMQSMFSESGFESKLYYYNLDNFAGIQSINDPSPLTRFQRTSSWCVNLIPSAPANFGMIYRSPIWGTCPAVVAPDVSAAGIYSQGQKIIANEGYRKYGYFGAGIASSYDGSTIAIGGNYGNAIDYLTAHSGSVHIYVKNGNTWQFQAELVSPVDVAYNEFGVRDRAIGLSSDGNVLAVGEPERGGGHVHVYSRVGTSWFYRASLPNPSSLSGEGGTTDKYGASLSISSFGDVILIGADGDVAGTGTVRGTAYVWRNYGFKDSPNWQLEATLVPSGGNYQRQFGWSTALSKDGTVAVIGAIAEPDIEAINVLNMGAAYIFRRNSNGTWIQESRLLPSLRQSQALFGVSVAMTGDGSTIVVGALGGKIGQRIGRVYIYRRTVSGSFYSTTLTQFLDSDQPGPSYQSDDYGDSVSLSEDGQILVVGAPEQNTQTGKVYVYVRNLNGTYVQRQTLVNSDTTLVDRIGGALVVSPGSGLVLTSAPRHTPTYPDLFRAGAVYVWNTI